MGTFYRIFAKNRTVSKKNSAENHEMHLKTRCFFRRCMDSECSHFRKSRLSADKQSNRHLYTLENCIKNVYTCKKEWMNKNEQSKKSSGAQKIFGGDVCDL